MKLKGSCHCGSVSFSVEAPHPYPYMRCYCSICRKTAGGGGYAINLGADYSTLEVAGEKNINVYHALIKDDKTGETREAPGGRYFCKHCGSALWAWDPRWPQLVHPHASAIDTELPAAPSHVHIMLDSKASWVPVEKRQNDKTFDRYPDESLAQWHERQGLIK